VAGEVAVNPAPAVELPRTGEGLELAGIGGIAIVLGGLARLVSRKRPAKR
jgi:LPXTG-motif cell wall-anchored protein